MIQELQEKLHNEIPLTKLMQVNINKYNKEELVSNIPLEININDKGTAFGGSLSTLTTISAWSMCWLISKELEINSTNIVVIKNETSFFKPVTKDIVCHTKKPSFEDILIVKEKIDKKGSASIKIESQIIENNETCVVYTGFYVITK
ncbi:thioesterase [Poseidonibacter parvus]|uniref:Thioesterase n=1 Tax=Poseidonibacter parvus TaxID=1850254 RepID=A0A1P8KLQ5_9BACT|nr:YiiD C-terminal domain-containing protein [Poseidonibacter parvus]APW65466.1 thioesterase [Poseidonibacter parvus]